MRATARRATWGPGWSRRSSRGGSRRRGGSQRPPARTLLGLAGYGDLLASVEQPDRPEILLGAALGRGKTLEEAKAEARLRVEAVDLIPRIAEFAAAHKVSAPIFGALSEGILKAQPVAEVIKNLMTSPIEGFV